MTEFCTVQRNSSLPPANQSFHAMKSRWLKAENKWLTPFKFLGLEYDGILETVKGNTRQGSRLEVDTRRSEIYRLLKALRPDYGKVQDLVALSHSGVFGLFVSKLYCGSWTIPKYVDHEWRVDPNSWFGDNIPRKGDPLLSSVACLWLRSAIDYSIHHTKKVCKLWQPED